VANPETSFLNRTWARLGAFGKTLVALGLVAAVGGTAYSTLIEPKVEDVIAGESRLRVTVLRPGEFTIRGLPHNGAWIFPPGSPGPEDFPSARIQGRSDEFNTWALKNGGVAAETLAMRLSVRARDESPVILHGLRIDVVERERPLEGWFFYPEHGCGVQPVRTVSVFLDEEPVVPLDPRNGKPFDITVRVSKADPEVYEIHATTYANYVEFRLTLLYDSETGTGRYEVDGGATFAVTGIRRDASAYRFPYFDNRDSARGLERDASLDGAGLGC
jgi:hypothetical protein